MLTRPYPTSSVRTLRALALVIGLALLPWSAAPASSLTPEPAPGSSRFT